MRVKDLHWAASERIGCRWLTGNANCCLRKALSMKNQKRSLMNNMKGSCEDWGGDMKYYSRGREITLT
jgi:hypothetical protein